MQLLRHLPAECDPMTACEDWIAYHGLSTPLAEGASFTFGDLSTHPSGFHVGSLEQAVMRGRPNCQILKLKIRGASMSRAPKRVRDRPNGWHQVTRRHARAGCEALVYLNRHEGFPVAALERLTPKELSQMDNMPEAKLRRLLPELEDSWVILDPRLVDMVEVLSRDQAKLMLRNCDPDQTPRPAPDAAMSSPAQSSAR